MYARAMSALWLLGLWVECECAFVCACTISGGRGLLRQQRGHEQTPPPPSHKEECVSQRSNFIKRSLTINPLNTRTQKAVLLFHYLIYCISIYRNIFFYIYVLFPKMGAAHLLTVPNPPIFLLLLRCACLPTLCTLPHAASQCDERLS